MSDVPLLSIAFGLGVAGAVKLAGLQFTIDNFERWGYSDPTRLVIGAIEATVAALAIGALAFEGLRPVAAVGTLCSMAGAAATHIRSEDSAPNLIPPTLLSFAALAVLAKRSS